MGYLTYNSASNRYPIRGFSNPNAIRSPDVPGDPFFGNVVLFLKGNDINNSTTIIDSSPFPKTITLSGNPIISTAQSKYGGSSIFLDGSSYLSIPAIQLDGAFAVECLVYRLDTATLRSICSVGTFSSGILLRADGSAGGTLFVRNTVVADSFTDEIGLTNWAHVAITRDNSNLVRLFIKGQLYASATVTGTINSSASSVFVGASVHAPGEKFNGYIDSFRITDSVPRYITNFNPETDTFLIYD